MSIVFLWTGTLSNEHAGYRACKCLRRFYRLDRFGPCSECPAHGIKCVDDTAILAPNYFWKWANQSSKEFYKEFVDNIHSFGPDYNDTYSKFTISLPKPVKCPFAGSCKGGIDSECEEGYQGNLCATCSHGYYLRFNFCLKCPGFLVSIISSLVVIGVFILMFTMVLWGDSKKTENNRTVADIIMSCFKIVIGFYQVISGVFSALTRVHWPVTLIAMDKFLKLFDGNIFQFAPWSCVYSQLRLNPFLQFILVLSVTFVVVSFAFVYMFLQLLYIKGNKDRPESEKLRALSRLKRSCYRNIFLFLLASYPMTSKTIIQILPLPGACVKHCFSDEGSQCISLMKADYSIQCFTPQHKTYWPFAAVFSVYPVGFPLMVLLLIYKYRQSERYEELSFGLKVFFENYKDKFWFWEITEMYRKLILISLIFLFGSGGVSQIGLTLLVVSVFGVAYTFFRPIKGKFEDLLQTFVLWVIFFDVCLGAMYSTSDVTKDNDSLIVNILFVVLNSSVLLVALGKPNDYSTASFLTDSMSRAPSGLWKIKTLDSLQWFAKRHPNKGRINSKFEKKERREKKSDGRTISFYIGFFAQRFWPKKVHWPSRSICWKRFQKSSYKKLYIKAGILCHQHEKIKCHSLGRLQLILANLKFLILFI